MDQRIIDLYDEYTHTPLDRRVFLARLAALVGGAAAAQSLLPLLETGTAHAAIVPAADQRLDCGRITFASPSGDVAAYRARPKKGTKLPAVIVIHENRGLNAHIEDVARRLALEGFFAVAPDFLSPVGGTPAEPDSARAWFGKLDRPQTVQNAVAAVAFLAQHADCNGKVGAVGFCWGGALVGDLAVASPDLDAGVVYYGRQPKAEDVPKIQAPLLLHYAGEDARIAEGIPAFVAALDAAKKEYTLHNYEGAQHAFNNDTSEARYDKKAADLAWSRTVAFLRVKLRT